MSAENTDAPTSEPTTTDSDASAEMEASAADAIRDIQSSIGMTADDIATAAAADSGDEDSGQPAVAAAPDDETATPPGDEAAPAAEDGEPAPDAAEAKEPEAEAPQGRSTAELYERLAKGDARYQAERNKSAELAAELAALKEQPQVGKPPTDVAGALAYLDQHVPGGFIALATHVRDNGTGAPAQPAQPGQVPQTAQDERIAKLEAQLAEQGEARAAQAAQTERAQRQESLAGHLKAQSGLDLLSATGRYDLVLEQVEQHYGSHGTPGSEREAAEVVTYCAREVERGLQAEADKMLQNEALRAVLARKMGRENEEPARQETKGNTGGGNGAPPDLSDLASQRHETAEDLNTVSTDELLSRAAREATAAMR